MCRWYSHPQRMYLQVNVDFKPTNNDEAKVHSFGWTFTCHNDKILINCHGRADDGDPWSFDSVECMKAMMTLYWRRLMHQEISQFKSMNGSVTLANHRRHSYYTFEHIGGYNEVDQWIDKTMSLVEALKREDDQRRQHSNVFTRIARWLCGI